MICLHDEVNFCSYTDNNTPYRESETVKDASSKLKTKTKSILKLFSNDVMKVSLDKCHLLLNSTKKSNLAKKL